MAVLVVLLAVGGIWVGRGGGERREVDPGREEARPEREVRGPGAALSAADTATPRVVVEPGATVPEGAGTVMRIRVVDDLAQPVAGASVADVRDEGNPLASTGADGRCEVSLPSSEASGALLCVEKEGHFHQRSFFSFAEELEIVLPRTAALSGTVLERDGDASIGGATVALEHASCIHCPPDRVTADAAGRFVLPAVPVGTAAYFLVEADGFGPLREKLTLPSPEAARRDFLLTRTELVRGRVVDAVTGAGVRGARLELDGPPTEADGSFVLEEVLADDDLWIDVEAPGYCETWGEPDVDALRRGEPLVVPLLPAAFVRGRVTDATGAPVSGAAVELEEDDRRMARGGRFTAREERLAAYPLSGWDVSEADDVEDVVTGANGGFTGPGLVPWTAYLAEVSAEGYVPARVEVEVLGGPGAVTTLEVVLAAGSATPPPTGSLRGVLTWNGEPVPGRLIWRKEERLGVGRAGPDGRFLLEDLPAGSIELEALPEPPTSPLAAMLRTRQTPKVVEVAAGVTTEQDVAVELPTKPIEGRVRTERGEPLAGVRVLAGGQPGFLLPSVTDGEGRFRFPLPDDLPGPFRLELDHALFRIVLKDVAAGTTDVELVVPERGELRLRVVEEGTGRLEEDPTIWYRRPGATELVAIELPRSLVPDVDGWLALEAAVGSLEILARGDEGGPTVLEPARVQAGATTSLELRLPAAGRLTLQCAPDGRALLERDLLLLTPAEHREEVERGLQGAAQWSPLVGVLAHHIVFDADGRAKLPPLAEGLYVLCAGSPELVVEPAEIRVVGGETATIDVRLRD